MHYGRKAGVNQIKGDDSHRFTCNSTKTDGNSLWPHITDAIRVANIIL